MEITNQIQSISFSTFNEQQVREFFGLKEELKKNLLEEWESRAKKMTIDSEEQRMLDRLHTKLKLYVRSWNEEDLKLKFIGHLIELVNFDDYEQEITAFAERSISATFNEIEIKGVVDLMVATGISIPRQPFFFIHEYKREKDNSGDPVGQLLSTMFVAQKLNKKPQRLSLFHQEVKDYSDLRLAGVYVIGRMWVFVALDGHRYYLSKSFDSTNKEELIGIFKMLKAQKEIIFEIIKQK